MLKKVAVKKPTEVNPHPQGVFTKVNLPDACAIVDEMKIVFAEGAGDASDMLITVKGIEHIDGCAAQFVKNIEMADFADFVANCTNLTFLFEARLEVYNLFMDVEVKTKLYKIADVARMMPGYIDAESANTLIDKLAGVCSEGANIYGKLEYVLNNQD